MSFLHPGPADHAVADYQRARKWLRRWRLMMSTWFGASVALLTSTLMAAIIVESLWLVAFLVLLLGVCGCALVVSSGRYDQARRNLRAAHADLLSYGLNPEDYQ